MKNVCKWIAVAFIIIGFMFLLGTAGTSDLDLIGTKEVITRCLCGLGMMGAGVITAYIIEEKENA